MALDVEILLAPERAAGRDLGDPDIVGRHAQEGRDLTPVLPRALALRVARAAIPRRRGRPGTTRARGRRARSPACGRSRRRHGRRRRAPRRRRPAGPSRSRARSRARAAAARAAPSPRRGRSPARGPRSRRRRGRPPRARPGGCPPRPRRARLRRRRSSPPRRRTGASPASTSPVSARPARRAAVTTATTPGWASARDVSIRRTRARGCSENRSAPWSIPGATRSPTNCRVAECELRPPVARRARADVPVQLGQRPRLAAPGRGDQLDRVEDLHVARAATEIAEQRVRDLLARGRRVLRRSSASAFMHDARRAEAALGCACGGEALGPELPALAARARPA